MGLGAPFQSVGDVVHPGSRAQARLAGCGPATSSGPEPDKLERRTLAKDTIFDRFLDLVKVDFAPSHRPPPTARVVLATVVSLVGSLAVDAGLVAIGETVFPSTKGYVHFQFSDYAKLTIIGVIIACVAWPIVTRISSAPRWLFLRLAIAVTLVLWLPDLYILKQGQPAKAVAVLMCMHLAIAVVTYNALMHVAPVRPRDVVNSEVDSVLPN